jgi:hypothetical protein
LKPAFFSHQCFSASLQPPNRSKATRTVVKFLRRARYILFKYYYEQ